MFLFSFTKKPVNKTVDDSHDIGSHSKIKNLKICRGASMLFYIKRCLKVQGKICRFLRGVFRHIHFLKQASVWIPVFFFMTPVLVSLSLKKKIHPVKCEIGHLRSRKARFSVMACPSFFYPCRLWFGDVLVICLVLKFFPEVVDGFV